MRRRVRLKPISGTPNAKAAAFSTCVYVGVTEPFATVRMARSDRVTLISVIARPDLALLSARAVNG